MTNSRSDYHAPGLSPRGRSAPQLFAIAALMLLFVLGDGVFGQAQQRAKLQPDGFRIQIERGLLGTADQGYQWDKAPLLIDTPAPMLNLLDRAEEATGRGDWKLAIDSLQRVIDDPQGALLPRSEGAAQGGLLYESARRHARRRIGALPPEGLRAYRLIYDGKARGMLERAREAHDESTLRVVVDRFLLTSVGDEAADLLASWLLDEGRAGEALALLSDLVEFSADRDVPPQRVAGKMAVAFQIMGRQEDAQLVLDEIRAQRGSVPDPLEWVVQVAQADPPLSTEFTASTEAFEPQLLESTPWRYDLGGGVDSVWQRLFEEDAGGPAPIGLAELATDGERVFVRQRGGCTGLWPDDLSVVWRAELSSTPEVAQRDRSVEAQLILGKIMPPRFLDDDASKLISTAAGLVFVIEPAGVGEYHGNDVTSDVGLEVHAGVVPTASGATRLVAMDAASGAVRWHRGRTGQPADVLGNVQFTSVPILVGRNLWVPYFSLKDFYVAVLRPEDGAVVRTVLLGSVQEFNAARRFATPMGQGAGVVYVPSGYGTLFALDGADFSLRWAAQYNRSPGAAARAADAGWLPSAPVSVGGMVVLAATDHSALLAFSAADGSFAWSLEPNDATYVLAARDDRIWLGGRGISSHSVRDGSLLWQTQLGAVPTGRGALFGNRIFLPTSGGLGEFEADSGEHLGTQPLASGQMPPGNLLCLDPALFSLDSVAVRRYPDLARSRTLSHATYAANPRDMRAATQLAWAELLSGNARRASEITDAFAGSLSGTDVLTEGMRRVRIEALLTQAGQVVEPQEALAFLTQADQAARSPDQRTRVRFAVADQLSRMGRPVDAHRTLLELGLESQADHTVRLADAVEISARRDIARRLRELWPKLTEQETEAINQELAQRIARAAEGLAKADPAAHRELSVIADLDPTGPAGQRALFVLADWEIRRQRYEAAEQLLMECMRREGEPDLTLAANLKLCEMYTAGLQSAVSMLEPCLRGLESRFGGQPIPPAPWPKDPQGDPAASQGLVGEWVSKQRLAMRSVNAPAFVEAGTEPLQLTGERLWSYGFEPAGLPPRMVGLDDENSPVTSDSVLVFGTDDVLECLDARGGDGPDSKPTLRWRTELRLPGSFLGPPPRAYRDVQQARRGVVDGQIGVFNASDGLFGVGLITGRRLWVRPYDSPLESDLVPYRDSLMAAADGLVAAMPKAGRLSVLRAMDGTTVWERDLRGEPVTYLWMEGDRVLTADASMQRLHIFDRADGRLVGLALFRQLDVDAGLVRLVRAGGVVCGPDSSSRSEAISAVRLDTGQPAWRLELGKPVGQLFVLDDEKIGVGLIGGDIRIVDAPSGEVILDRHFTRGLPATEGVLVDGTLVAQAERRHGQLKVPELVAIDLATGEEVWSRSDLAALSEPPGPLVMQGGSIAALVDSSRTQIKAQGAAVQQNVIGLTMIDVRTGQTSGSMIDLPLPHSGTRVSRDMVIRSGVLVVGSNKWVQAYRLSPPPAPDPGRGF